MRHRYLRSAWLFALGFFVLWLLNIPQISLYTAYRIIAIGVLGFLAIQVLLRYSLAEAVVFMALMSVLGWAMDITETVMLPFNAAASVIVVLFAGMRKGNVYAGIVWGCVCGGAVLVLGAAALVLWLKDGSALQALRYGLYHQWMPVASGMVGCLLSAYLYRRGRPD